MPNNFLRAVFVTYLLTAPVLFVAGVAWRMQALLALAAVCSTAIAVLLSMLRDEVSAPARQVVPVRRRAVLATAAAATALAATAYAADEDDDEDGLDEMFSRIYPESPYLEADFMQDSSSSNWDD